MIMRRITLYCLLLLLLFLPSLTQAKIVFKSKRDGSARMYVMDDDGRNVQRLTAYNVLWPVWSPDGKQIAFSKSLPVAPKQLQKSAIFIINSDGSNEHRLTDDNEDNLNGNRLFEGNASWSPDGLHIAFISYRGGDAAQIWTINLITREMRQLTRTDGLTTAPAWSPDGKYIAYRDDALIRGYPTIFVMRADGSGQRELAKSDLWRMRVFPRWSPDSQSVVYVEDTFAQEGERLVRVSRKAVIHNIKSGKRVDTPDDWHVHSACFMGSKHLLISAKGREGNPEKYDIYRYHLVTGEIVNLTNTPGDDFAMDWISDDVLSVTPQGKKKSNMGRAKAVKP